MRTTTQRIALAAATLLIPVSALAQGGPPGRPPPPVRVETARMLDMAPTIVVPGTVISRDDARLAAEVTGRLVTIAEVGAEVAEGEAVAIIEDTALKLQRLENEGLVARAEARIPYLDSEVDRLKKLARQNNAARSQLEQTESDLAVARNDLKVARARLSLVEVQLAKTRITAPFPGIVTERLQTPGEVVSAGQEVVRLMNPGRLEVVARAPLSSMGHVTPGSELAVQGRTHQGTGIVRTQVPFGDARSHMFEVRVDLPPTPWRTGENVRLTVPTDTARQLLAVPRDALVLRSGGAAVFRVNDDLTAQRVGVTTGVSDGVYIAVDGALSAGDRVIVRGAERLRDGQTVSIMGAQSQGRPGGPAASSP